MLELTEQGSLLVFYGDWYTRLDNIYLGHDRMELYRSYGDYIKWITNDRIRVYIHVKLIHGGEKDAIINGIFSKLHLHDPVYRDIMKENKGE